MSQILKSGDLQYVTDVKDSFGYMSNYGCDYTSRITSKDVAELNR